MFKAVENSIIHQSISVDCDFVILLMSLLSLPCVLTYSILSLHVVVLVMGFECINLVSGKSGKNGMVFQWE